MNESSCLFVKFVLYTGRISWGGDPAIVYMNHSIRKTQKSISVPGSTGSSIFPERMVVSNLSSKARVSGRSYCFNDTLFMIFILPLFVIQKLTNRCQQVVSQQRNP